MKNVLIILVVLLVGLGVIFGVSYFGLFQYKFFAPKYEKARREVFENTQSYVEGKRQEIIKYKLEYDLADTEQDKNALKYTILQTTANLDLDLLEDDLKDFVLELR